MPEPGIEPRPLAPQSDALHLDHQDKRAYRLKSSYLKVLT